MPIPAKAELRRKRRIYRVNLCNARDRIYGIPERAYTKGLVVNRLDNRTVKLGQQNHTLASQVSIRVIARKSVFSRIHCGGRRLSMPGLRKLASRCSASNGVPLNHYGVKQQAQQSLQTAAR